MEQERRNPRNMKFEYVLPSSWWTETADSHCLLIDVPGFKKEDVRIRADSNDHVIVSGERQANDNTILHFEQAYKVPEGCNILETNAILEDETYYVIISKKPSSKNEKSISTSAQTDRQPQDSTSEGVDNTSTDDSNQNREEMAKEDRSDNSLLKKLSKMMKKKRCLVLTALLAISLGVLVSYRYQSTPQQNQAKGGLIFYQKEAKKRAGDDA